MSNSGERRMDIVLAGDSTVTDSSGWGRAFRALLKPEVGMMNLAVGGRSSRSFRDEGHWDKVLNLRARYVLIQFGHNDCPGKGPERESTPEQFREHIGRFVDEVRAADGVPVLVTSLERRHWTAEGRIEPSLTAYAEAVKAVAREKGVALVDLHARSIEFYEAMGPEAMKAISPHDGEGKEDGTHLNEASAEKIAPLVVEELRAAVPEFGRYLAGS